MAVETLGIEFVTEGFEQINKRLDTLDQQMDGLGNTASKSGGMVSSTLAVALGSVLAKAAEVAAGALIEVGKTMVGAFQESFKMAVDFESAMTVLSLAAKETGLSFDQLHDAAIAVGGDATLVGVSASGAADSMTELFKAGLSNTEVFGDLQGYLAGTAELGGALRASIDLAAATELDMVQASELAAVALSTFGGELETEEERANFVNVALNNFVQSADASVASVSDLAAALKNVGPTAASFGFSIQDTNNALAILSTRGISGAEAGTALKSMMTNLMRPTDAVKGALAELNVSLFNTDGTMRSLPQIIGDFEGAMAGLTEEQKLNYTQTLAGTFGMKAFSTLIEEGTEGWIDMADATARANGIQEQSTAIANTFAGRLEAFNGVIETLKIQIGEAFLPVATELLSWFTTISERYGPAIVSTIQEIASVFGALSNYILAIAEDGDVLNDWLTHLPPSLQEFVYVMLDAFQKFMQWWSTNGPIIQQVIADVFDHLNLMLLDISRTALPMITRLLSRFSKWFDDNGDEIVKLVQLIGIRMGEVADAIAIMWRIVSPILEALINIVLDLGTIVLNIIEGDWTEAWQAAGQLVDDAMIGIQGSFTALANWVSSWFGTSWADVQGQWSDSWNMLKEIADITWQNITQAVSDAGDKIAGFLSAIASNASKALTDTEKGVTSFISGVTSSIANFITTTQNNWFLFWQNVQITTEEILLSIELFIQELIATLFEWIGINQDEFNADWRRRFEDMELITKELWRRLVDYIKNIVEEMRSNVESAIERIRTNVETAFTAMVTLVQEKALAIYTAVVGYFQKIGDWLTENVQTLIDYGKKLIDGIVKGITEVGSRIAQAVGDAIASITDKISDIWDTIKGYGKRIIDGIAEGISGAVSVVVGALSDLLDSAFSSITDAGSDLYKKIIGAGKNIINGLIQGIRDGAGTLADTIGEIVDGIIQMIKDALLIGSPSRVTQEFGRNIMQGLEAGILESLPSLVRTVEMAMEPVVQSISPGATSVTNNYYNTANSAYNLTTNSTLRPGGLAMEFQGMSLIGR